MSVELELRKRCETRVPEQAFWSRIGSSDLAYHHIAITLSARPILFAGNVPLKGTYDVQVEAHCDKPTISLQPNSAAGVSLAHAANG